MPITCIDPTRHFGGTILVVTPHMDDEALACGGTLAMLHQKERIHILYATDGSKSPTPVFRWLGDKAADLVMVRKREARAAMGIFGIPEQNLFFLDLPDSELKRHFKQLTGLLCATLTRLKPDYIFIPFRYDRHPDHLALNHAIHQALQFESCRAKVVEYFVYYRYRLIHGGDIRKYVRTDHLLQVETSKYSELKRDALQLYQSQTTIYSAWQDRPILPGDRIRQVSQAPELFLQYNPDFPGPAIFSNSATWVRFIHSVEPFIKKRKEQFIGFVRTATRENGIKPS